MSIDFAPEPSAVEVFIKHLTDAEYMAKRIEAAEDKAHQLHDAIRCAADYLRDGAPGKALEVLEANMR